MFNKVLDLIRRVKEGKKAENAITLRKEVDKFE